LIRIASRLPNDMVMVFDEDGEQFPEYQGEYKDVCDSIMEKAPVDCVFAHCLLRAPNHGPFLERNGNPSQ